MFNAEIPEEDILGALQRLEEKFEAEEFSFQLYKAAGGYQFLTKPAYQASIGIMLKQQSKKRLSTSAMETLSIIAYKQPISKTEIENIRGVNCDYAVQKLLDKSLIEITGKADTIGRPMLYGTTPKFMEYFGINDLNQLPIPKEAMAEVNSIGQNAESPDQDMEAVASTEERISGGVIESVATDRQVDALALEEELTSSIVEEEVDRLEIASADEGVGEPDIESPEKPDEPENQPDAQT